METFLGSISTVKLGWSIVVVALIVAFIFAVRTWWSELGEVENLRSQIKPGWKHIKDLRR